MNLLQPMCLVLGAASALMSAACHEISSYSVPTTSAGRAAPYAGPVVVFAANRPPVEAKELGVVEVAGAGDERDLRVLFPELIRRVQKLGGNAVALEKMGAVYEAIPTWSYGNMGLYRCGWGTCSRWDAYPTHFESMSVVLRGRALRLPSGGRGEP